jgi:hypothetical protein
MRFNDIDHKNIKTLLAILLPAFLWAGCTTKVGGVSPNELAKDAEIKLLKFQSQDLASVTVGEYSEYKTNNRTLTFEGSCPKDVPTVRVKFNGVDAGVGAPCNNETFVWSKTDAATPNEIVTAEFYLANIAGVSIDGVTLSKKFYVDTLPPTAPATLTVNGTQVDVGGIYPITSPDGSVSIAGVISSNDAATYVSTDAAGSFSSQTPGAFTFNTTLSSGETRAIIFSFTDSLGNSSTAQIVLAYNVSLMVTSPYMIQVPATAQASANTVSGNYTLARTTVDQNGSQTKSSGSYSMEVGTTNLLKQVQ